MVLNITLNFEKSVEENTQNWGKKNSVVVLKIQANIKKIKLNEITHFCEIAMVNFTSS